MTSNQLDEPEPPEGPHESAASAWARGWNELWQPRRSERAPPLGPDQQLQLERLYPIVEADLRRLAATARHLWLGESVQDRVYVLFAGLALGLVARRSPLNPEGNIRALLVQIANSRGIDRFREDVGHHEHQAPLDDERPPAPGAPGLEEAAVARSHEAAILAATWAYWATLPSPDRDIVELRHEGGGASPRPFVAIAARLGPQFRPNTVQKIYYRTLERTREHLRSLGLLDDEGAD